MGIEVTGMEYSVIDPKEIDYENISDDKYYSYKLTQPGALLAKSFELAKLIYIESNRLEEIRKQAKPPKVENNGFSASIRGPQIIDRTRLSTLEFSLLLMQFTCVEAICNIISECALRQNKNKQILLPAEVDFLCEKTTVYENGKIKTKESFVNLDKKVKEYIKLFAKVNGEVYDLDLSTHVWTLKRPKRFVMRLPIREMVF